jgi:hypothetical protein
MTDLYGSTLYGKKLQIMDAIISNSIKTGDLYLKNKDYYLLDKYSTLIAKLMVKYIFMFFGEGVTLLNYIRNSNINIFHIESKYISFNYKPTIMLTKVKQKYFKKAYRVLFNTNEIDYKN